jgi:hypothetical protein
MFKKNILSGAFFSVLLLSGAIPAHAQTTLSVNQPDLLLCFEILDQSSTATGGQENLEVDLGSLSSIESAAAATGSTSFGTRLSLTDLTQTYGGNWNASNSGNGIFWSVFSASASNNEVYTTDSVQPKSDTNGHLSPTNSLMSQVYSDMDGNQSTANSNYAYVTNSQSDSNSFTQSVGNGSNGGTNWGDFNSDVPGNVLKQTTSSTAFAFYDMKVTSSQTAATEIGTFGLSSAGVLTFTEVSAVPEPSTWAAILVGSACLVLYRPKRLRA